MSTEKILFDLFFSAMAVALLITGSCWTIEMIKDRYYGLAVGSAIVTVAGVLLVGGMPWLIP